MCERWRLSSKRGARSFAEDQSGATAIEFAIVVWPLVFLIFGTIEVGRVVWTQTALDKTVMTAARCIGIRSEGCADAGVFNLDLAVAFVQKEAGSWGVPVAKAAIAIEDAADCDGAPSQSKVSISTEIFSPFPFIAKLMSGSEKMQAKACFPTQVSS